VFVCLFQSAVEVTDGSSHSTVLLLHEKKANSVALSPRANYTD
jgi:hypothetical protein